MRIICFTLLLAVAVLGKKASEEAIVSTEDDYEADPNYVPDYTEGYGGSSEEEDWGKHSTERSASTEEVYEPESTEENYDIDPNYVPDYSEGIGGSSEESDWGRSGEDYTSEEDEIVKIAAEGAVPTVGQASGVAADDDTVVVFQRRDHTWDETSFDMENNYKKKNEGPIKGSTIVELDESGKSIKEYGGGLFYMPHGITLDNKDNLWVTDVAQHQVHKMKRGSDKLTMSLGEAFVTGADNKHFCKPTDVAVASKGCIFVADGYCNSRVVKFFANGTVHAVIGKGDFSVPHSLALLEGRDMICVADRENHRVMCYNAGLKNASRAGEKMMEIKDPNMGRVFAVAFSEHYDLLYAVTGPTDGLKVAGFSIAPDSGAIVDVWDQTDSFENPHDLAVNPEGDRIFVAEIGPNRVVELSYVPLF